jgi:hypothetical protein
LGTKSQRGLTQMAMDILFQSTGNQLVQSFYGAPAFSSLTAADVSEAHMFTATAFLDSMYGDNQPERAPSRAQTPMPVSRSTSHQLRNLPHNSPLHSPSRLPTTETLCAILHPLLPVGQMQASIPFDLLLEIFFVSLVRLRTKAYQRKRMAVRSSRMAVLALGRGTSRVRLRCHRALVFTTSTYR